MLGSIGGIEMGLEGFFELPVYPLHPAGGRGVVGHGGDVIDVQVLTGLDPQP